MKVLKIYYFTLISIIILGCSTTQDEPDEPDGPLTYELKSKIIGKWNTNFTEEDVGELAKQANERCIITYFIFRADGTFLMEYQDGVVEGTYKVLDETNIELDNLGTISQINFNFQALTFQVELPGVCTQTGQFNNDPDFVHGYCYSFLNCYDNSNWKNSSENKDTYIRFSETRTWIEKFVYNTTDECLVPTSNTTDIGIFTIFEHYVKQIKFVHQKPSELIIYTYRELDNGNIEETIETESGSTIKIYEPAEESEINDLPNVQDCRPKTYIPDEVFENRLIEIGYDDIMDNFVLTENIENIVELEIFDGVVTELTGITDFKSLESLTVYYGSYTEVDLSQNLQLKKLNLWDTPLMNLDLSKNIKLESFFFDNVEFTELDISNNPELRIIDVSRTPLKSLDLSNNKKVEVLILENDSIQNLTLVENQNLKLLEIEDFNPIIEIDVSLFENLEQLSLDRSNFTKLDISQNLKLKGLSISGNESLSCVKVNSAQKDAIENETGFFYDLSYDSTVIFSLECEN